MTDFTRIKKIASRVTPSLRSVTMSQTDSVQDYFSPKYNYFLCSQLPNIKNTSCGQIHTTAKMFWLMEGNKRITGTGQSNAYSLWGNSDQSYFVHHRPVMCVYDIPLDVDDYIVDFTIQGGDCAYFVTNKGYVYSGASLNDYGTIGDGTTINRYAFTRVNHARSTTTATFSSGGAISATTMVISAANANIIPGQFVVGTGCPTGMQVTAVSGTTITFNYPFHTQAAGTYSFGVPFGPGGIKGKKVYANGSVNWGGEKFVYILGEDNNLYSCGYNGHGQLGNATTTNRPYFDIVQGISNVKEITAIGMYSVYILNFSGQLYGLGWNGNGQFGIGNTTNQTTPTLIASNVAKAFIKDWDYAMAWYITNEGRVWAAGHNGNGTLGIGTNADNNTTTWTAVTTLNAKNIIDIKAAGWGLNNSSSWFLADDGTIYSSGYNGYGQLGDGTTTARTTPGLLTQPTGFPKVDRIFCGGGSTTHFLTAVNMASGRMFSVGSWNYGAIGQALGSATATWAMTSTSTRAQYPAREVTSPPPVEDGYTSIKDFCITSNNNGETTVYALLADGTVWVRGYGYFRGAGHKYISQYTDSNYDNAYGVAYNTSWKQVEFY